MRRILTLGSFLPLLLAACGGEAPDRQTELQALMDQDNAQELMARVELALDEGDETGFLYFARGWAELRQDADLPAKKSFAEAVRLDPELSGRIARLFHEKALVDAEEKWYDRAKQRMREAYRYDPNIELEPLADGVGDLVYRFEKDYAAALPVYAHLRTKTDANWNKRMEWQYRYGHCLERTGEIQAALAAYKEYFDTFTTKKQGQTQSVIWRWMTVHKEQAEEALARNDLNGALSWITQAPMEGWHMDLQQQIRLVAGRIREARGEYELALDEYEQILEDGDTFGGQVVADAKDRIDAIHALGIH